MPPIHQRLGRQPNGRPPHSASWRAITCAVVCLLGCLGAHTARAEPIHATELVYKVFQSEGQAKVLVVALGLYAVIPAEIVSDLPAQRQLKSDLNRLFEAAYAPFLDRGWRRQRPVPEGPYEWGHERVRVELDRRRKGDVITYYNTVCDPVDLFNKKKYREGIESFREYWSGLVEDVEGCLREKHWAR